MGPLSQTRVVAIADSSQAAVARRSAREGAERVGLTAGQADALEIVAVELATNLLHHAGGGTLLINEFISEAVVELISIDSGPGMANVTECLADGFSTGSTPGLGLGSVRRLSTRMEAYSLPGKGTVMAVQSARGEAMPVLPGVVCTPLEGEPASGDRWACTVRDGRQLFLLVDGLGHGPSASAAAEMAVDIFLEASSCLPATLIEEMHVPMRGTRGAAVVVAAADPERKVLSFAGIGNISAGIFTADGNGFNLVSHNGTVGHQMRRVQTFEYPISPASLLILHSDGVATRWKLQDYPGLAQAAPVLVAGTLFRDFRRERDDATVLAARLA